MIVLLDTSTGLCQLTLVEGSHRHQHQWQADRQLAKGILTYIEQSLEDHGSGLHQLTSIGVYRGPGSFTGLRIGIAVCNTLADSLALPIVGATGNDWQEQALARLGLGETDRVVLPEYGGDAHITQPRK